jgi:hypothetical protein
MRSASLLALLVLTACGSDAPSGTETGGAAKLRVLNGARSAVTVLVDGETRLASLDMAAVSSYLTLGAGSHQIELRVPGASAGFTTSVNAATGDTAVVVGLASALTSGPSVIASVLPDTGAIPTAGMAKLRAVHLAPKAGAIWAWRVQPDFPTPVTFQFPYPYGTTTPYVQSTPGTWQVIVTPAGGDPTREVMARLSIAVGANQARTVAILDSAGSVRIVAVDAP